MTNSQLNKLKKLGLSEKEARLYLVSLEAGPANVAKLAQRSGVKRGTIYEFLDQMIEKGLLEVSFSGKRKLYCGVEPKKLQKIIDRQKDVLDDLAPELALLMSGSAQKPRIRYYEGREGIIAAYYEMLDTEENSEIIGYATYRGIYEKFTPKEIGAYIKKRVGKKIKEKLIMPFDGHGHEHIENSKKELRETIFIAQKEFPIKNEINVSKNKIAIFSLAEEMIAVIIESKQIADTQRAIFKLLWHNLKKNN